MIYDYRAGKKRIQEILDIKLEVQDKRTIKSVNDLTYDNSYKSWITAIFVDIRESSKLFTSKDQIQISKMIKSFTSEVIEILRGVDLNCLELGIRGDCVYAVYNTPEKYNINEIVSKSWDINTLINMLNALFKKKNYPTIKIGIGISTAQELIIKAGRKNVNSVDDNVDTNAIVWVGEAVTVASNLSGYGNKGYYPIVISSCTHYNITLQTDKDFFHKTTIENNTVYHGDIIKKYFNNWINEGMK